MGVSALPCSAPLPPARAQRVPVPTRLLAAEVRDPAVGSRPLPAPLAAACCSVFTGAFTSCDSRPHAPHDSHLGASSPVISFAEKVAQNTCLTGALSIFNVEEPHKKSED